MKLANTPLAALLGFLCWFMPVVNAQFHFFDHMFQHAGGGGQRMRQEEPSDSARYQREWKEGKNYICTASF